MLIAVALRWRLRLRSIMTGLTLPRQHRLDKLSASAPTFEEDASQVQQDQAIE